ncbi:MAG: hypothetical protein QNJ32_09720 [Xenococcaceae cyanobacterium MO_167.B27]|nr:hypothetical protein [Xenococcaceae cyanobacterium MO_167.B27]
MKPIKIKCLSYKNSIFTLSTIVFSAIIALILIFILSVSINVKAQDSPNIQPNNSVASCPQIDDRIGKKYQQENPEEEFDFEEAVFVEPPNPDGVTQVDIGLYVVDISHINAVENTYRLEGLINLVWCDPRFRIDSQEKRHEIYLEEDAAAKIKRIWWPSITFINEVGEYFRKNEELIIFATGTVEYREKFSVELKSLFDLTKFPFDQQTLKVEIESFAWDENEVKLKIDEQKTGFNSSLHLPEWNIYDLETQMKQKQELRSKVPFSKFLMQIKLIRKPGFYLWKVIIPLMILVIISWSVFWMCEESLAARISFSLTGILTVVAYQFLIAENLPNISYLTLMDAILSLSFVIIALTVVENIVVHLLNIKNLKFLAIKVDRICQFAFPSIYTLLLFVISLSYFAS